MVKGGDFFTLPYKLSIVEWGENYLAASPASFAFKLTL